VPALPALAEGKSGGAGFFLLLAERNEALGRRETALAARERAGAAGR
jgi:hypothetical protein